MPNSASVSLGHSFPVTYFVHRSPWSALGRLLAVMLLQLSAYHIRTPLDFAWRTRRGCEIRVEGKLSVPFSRSRRDTADFVTQDASCGKLGRPSHALHFARKDKDAGSFVRERSTLRCLTRSIEKRSIIHRSRNTVCMASDHASSIQIRGRLMYTLYTLECTGISAIPGPFL